MTVVLVEVRCWRCGRWLANVQAGARYDVRCPKCKARTMGGAGRID